MQRHLQALVSASSQRAVVAAFGIGAACYVAAKVYSTYRWTISSDDETMIGGLAELVDEGVVPPDDDEFVEGGLFGNLFEEPNDGLPGRDRYAVVARRKRWRRSRVKWVVRAALAAKVKFGTLVDTPPNREMLSDYIRKQMVEHGLRPSHIVQQYPAAVALALLPSEADVTMSNMLASGFAEQRFRDFKGPWTHSNWVVHIDRILFGTRPTFA